MRVFISNEHPSVSTWMTIPLTATGREFVISAHVGGFHVFPIHNRDRILPADCDVTVVLHNGCRIFVHAHAQGTRMHGDGIDQPSQPVPLAEVLVEDDPLREAKPAPKRAIPSRGVGPPCP